MTIRSAQARWEGTLKNGAVAILGECSYRYRNCEDMLKFFYEG
jgi:hypothetical protein